MAGGFLNIRSQAGDMSKSTASQSSARTGEKKTEAKNETKAAAAASANAGTPASSKPGTLASKSDEEKWDVTRPLRQAVGRLRPSDMRVRVLVLALLIVASAACLRFLLDYQLSAMQKFFGAAVLLLITGEVIRGWMDWDGFLGLIMFRDRSTLGWIDRQAQRHATLWKTLADVGAVMGYGLSSYFLLGKKEREPKRLALIWAAGLPLLLIFFLFVMPTAYLALRSAIGVSDLNSASAQMHAATPQGDLEFSLAGNDFAVPWITVIGFVVMLLGGMAAAAWVSIVAYAAVLVPPLANKLVSIALGLAGHAGAPAILPPPGGSPLIPGITPGLPLLEGVLALAMLMVVHEMSHGFLARVHRIKLENAGVVFYGILPFGAFVEPDEKELDHVPIEHSNQVLVAGSAANMLTAILAFLVVVGLSMVFVGPYFDWGAAQGFVKGTWQGSLYGVSEGAILFVGRCLGLILALNMLVGIVNLLPVPLFDGHRLMVAGVRNKLAAEAITYVTLAAFVINFLPWIFR